MAARKTVLIVVLTMILQTGCASTSEPIASKASEPESGSTVYRYLPLNANASEANTTKYRKAIQSLNLAIQKDRADAASLKRRGVLYAETAQFEKAEKDYEDAIDLLKLRPASNSKSALLSELHMHRALVRRERGDRAGALADLTASIDMSPHFWEPRFHRWQLCRELGKTSEANADREAGMKILPKVFSQTYDSDHGII
jgi:tetratricopeptide (TPR) repeat protein